MRRFAENACVLTCSPGTVLFYAKRREEPHMITSAFAGLTCMTVGLVGVITA